MKRLLSTPWSVARSYRPLLVALAWMFGLLGSVAGAEGSRTLYPSTYPASGYRANLDVQAYTQATSRYAGVVQRYTFLYVYAQADEYILTASSGRIGTSGGDVFLYGPNLNPSAYGSPGNETISALTTPVFTCSAATAGGGTGRGIITNRAQELAGPTSASAVAATGNTYLPCYYKAPTTGFYAVRFSGGSGGGGADAKIDPGTQFGNFNLTVAAWEVAVRSGPTSTTDLDGRAFTYALNASTGGNSLPVYFSYFTSTPDGYRYQLDLKGLDPNGFAVYVNKQGFLDTSDNSTLYHDLRGTNAQVDTPIGPNVKGQAAQYPVFFSSPVSNSVEVNRVLNVLGYDTGNPARPIVNNVSFTGGAGSGTAYIQQGGTFNFNVTLPGTYEVVISRNGTDFDPANTLNRVLRGPVTATNASTPVAAVWDGKDNSGNDFPVNVGVYKYRVLANVGEVHFPMVDAENNPNGGPVVTHLNGADSGTYTVFYDDRGYKDKSGDVVGTVNGSLCPAGASAAPSVPVNLLGVSSMTSYRNWQTGTNANTDCAAGAGWGDAKALDLWAYTRSLQQIVDLNIVGADVQVTKVHQSSGLSSGAVKAGDQVTYQITVQSAGGPATGVILKDTLPAGTTFVSATGNPSGPTNGVLTWNIGAMTSGQSLTYTVTLTAPSVATVEATVPTTGNAFSNVASITSTSTDSNSANNSATATTDVMDVKLLKRIQNISTGTALSKSDGSAGNPVISGKPQEKMQYCIDFTNYSGATVTTLTVNDTAPINTTVVSGSLTYSLNGVAQTPPTGALTMAGLSLPVGSLASGASGQTCFQVLVN